MPPFERSVLLVGATGAFGERLAEGLIRAGIAVIAIARDPARLQRLVQRLGPHVLPERRDRSDIDTSLLAEWRGRHPHLFALVDASGPFQGCDYRLPRAAIAAGLHYVDLADARDFVGGIDALDPEARAAGVAVLSGASSTPALSHAVLDHLAKDAQEIISIDVAIAPGNRAPRGLSVMQSILSMVGQPIRVYRSGRWTTQPGWGLNTAIALPDIGTRQVALCETPDLDLLVSRYRPRADAIFRAGLELLLLHRGLQALGLLVRFGIVRSLAPFAHVLRALADTTKAIGTDRGGMRIDIRLIDRDGVLHHRWWTLTVEAGDGPYIPTLPALAALKMLATGDLAWRGAAACVGLLPYSAIAEEFTAYAIKTAFGEARLPPPVFHRLLGNAFDDLPTAIRQAHDVRGFLALEGEADATGPDNWIGRAIAVLFRLPRPGKNLPVRVEMRSEADGSETWTRIYPGVTMRSNLRDPDPVTQEIDEVFGPVAVHLAWRITADGLALTTLHARLFGIPLPSFLTPRSNAREDIDANGTFRFDVPIALPLIGTIVHYRGWLKVAGAERRDLAVSN
jgi:saccharopine dehydrogenase-like NADP-dependent oxidoreductase